MSFRRPFRGAGRRPFRPALRSILRGPGGPSDFSQMLIAYGKAVRAHRQLARLAPSFFDAAVVDRERENRAAQRRWMATWEPVLRKVYGAPSGPPPVPEDRPRLPHPATQRAVERRLAEFRYWLKAGELARHRHQQRRPHAIPSFSQLARLLKLAFDLKCLALGLNSPNRIPDRICSDDGFTDLQRAYPLPVESEPLTPVAVSRAERPAPVPPASIAAAVPEIISSDSSPNRNDAWRRWSRHVRRLASTR